MSQCASDVGIHKHTEETPTHDNIMTAVTSQSVGGKDRHVVSKEWPFKWEKEIGPLTYKPRTTTKTQTKHPGGLKT